MRKGLRWKLVVAVVLVIAAVVALAKFDIWYASRNAEPHPATEAKP